MTVGLIKYICGEGDLTGGIELKSYFRLTLLEDVKLTLATFFRSLLLLTEIALRCAVVLSIPFPSQRLVLPGRAGRKRSRVFLDGHCTLQRRSYRSHLLGTLRIRNLII